MRAPILRSPGTGWHAANANEHDSVMVIHYARTELLRRFGTFEKVAHFPIAHNRRQDAVV